jgi:phage gpG-like protein
MFKMRGPTGRLAKLVDHLSTTEELFLRLRQEGAIEARKQVRQGFARGVDPYGNPWAPLKLRAGGPLRDTGRLSEFTVRLTSTGFVLTAGADYAAPHQYGAVILPKNGKWLTFQSGGRWYRLKKAVIPKRQMVPEGSWGEWENAFAERFETIVSEWAHAA